MEKLLAQLEECLSREIEVHEALAPIIGEKLKFLRTGKAEQVRDLCAKENALVQAGSELAKQRMRIAAALTQAIDPQAAEPLALGALIERLPADAQSQFTMLRKRLLERMSVAQKDTHVTRRAMERLVSHMTGLIRTVGGAMSVGPAYGSQGMPPRKAMAVSTFSMTG